MGAGSPATDRSISELLLAVGMILVDAAAATGTGAVLDLVLLVFDSAPAALLFDPFLFFFGVDFFLPLAAAAVLAAAAPVP